jgi:hypothetical protein
MAFDAENRSSTRLALVPDGSFEWAVRNTLTNDVNVCATVGEAAGWAQDVPELEVVYRIRTGWMRADWGVQANQPRDPAESPASATQAPGAGGSAQTEAQADSGQICGVRSWGGGLVCGLPPHGELHGHVWVLPPQHPEPAEADR